MIGCEEQSAVGTIFAFPIVDAAIGDDLRIGIGGMTPKFFPGGGVERDDRIVVGQDIHDAIDDERAEGIVIRVFDGIAPSDFEMRYVLLVDLLEGGKLSGIGRTTVIGPG